MSDSFELDARDRMTFRLHATPLRRLAVPLVAGLLNPFVELQTSGLQWVPERGPLVLASNHLSNFDVVATQLVFPRPIFFMGKAELFRFEPFGALLRDFGAFPVYRGEHDAWALRHARKVLDAGQVLGMFPEGHRSRGRGLLPARTGTARLAIEACSPVLPLAITGSDRPLGRFPGRGCISLTFLPLLHPHSDESPEDLTERVMRAIAAALPAGMRGAYAA